MECPWLVSSHFNTTEIFHLKDCRECSSFCKKIHVYAAAKINQLQSCWEFRSTANQMTFFISSYKIFWMQVIMNGRREHEFWTHKPFWMRTFLKFQTPTTVWINGYLGSKRKLSGLISACTMLREWSALISLSTSKLK